MAFNNYVKFMRGSLAAYNALATKNEDTLYFIKISDGETRLYWGDRLISDGEIPTEIKKALNDLTDVNIPEVSSIGKESFRYCGNLITISLPKVASIGKYAFSDCYKLETVNDTNALTMID